MNILINYLRVSAKMSYDSDEVCIHNPCATIVNAACLGLNTIRVESADSPFAAVKNAVNAGSAAWGVCAIISAASYSKESLPNQSFGISTSLAISLPHDAQPCRLRRAKSSRRGPSLCASITS